MTLQPIEKENNFFKGTKYLSKVLREGTPENKVPNRNVSCRHTFIILFGAILLHTYTTQAVWQHWSRIAAKSVLSNSISNSLMQYSWRQLGRAQKANPDRHIVLWNSLEPKTQSRFGQLLFYEFVRLELKIRLAKREVKSLKKEKLILS